MTKKLPVDKYKLSTIHDSKDDALFNRYGTFRVNHVYKDRLIEGVGFLSVTIVTTNKGIDFFNYHPSRKGYQYTHSMKLNDGILIDKELNNSLDSLERLYTN